MKLEFGKRAEAEDVQEFKRRVSGALRWLSWYRSSVDRKVAEEWGADAVAEAKRRMEN